jgi:hypothetical protein
VIPASLIRMPTAMLSLSFAREPDSTLPVGAGARRPDPGDLSFTLPLSVYSYRRLRFIGRIHGHRTYSFSFAIIDHPKRPKAQRIPVGTIIGFKGSTWQCAPAPGSLTCAEIDHGKTQTPIVVVLAKRRVIEVQTTTPPTCSLGTGERMRPSYTRSTADNRLGERSGMTPEQRFALQPAPRRRSRLAPSACAQPNLRQRR